MAKFRQSRTSTDGVISGGVTITELNKDHPRKINKQLKAEFEELRKDMVGEVKKEWKTLKQQHS